MPPPLDKDELANLLQEMAEAIKAADPVASGACLEKIINTASSSVPAEELEALERQVHYYDFESAQESLDRIRQHLSL